MTLHDPLPKTVTVEGKRYRLNLDFRRVLKMMDVMMRHDLMPEARPYAALKCVMRHPPRDAQRCGLLFMAVNALLFPAQQKADTDGKKLTDFVQDADLIRAAFMQDYGINLWRDRLHWFEFTALLSGLPEGSRYADILGIRARPMPKATKWNREEREWLMKAKARHALILTDEDIARNYNRAVIGLFDGLIRWAGDDHG